MCTVGVADEVRSIIVEKLAGQPVERRTCVWTAIAPDAYFTLKADGKSLLCQLHIFAVLQFRVVLPVKTDGIAFGRRGNGLPLIYIFCLHGCKNASRVVKSLLYPIVCLTVVSDRS